MAARKPVAKAKAKPRTPLEREEMVRILEQIARAGSDTARIQAIKTLVGLSDEDSQPASALDALDELAPRRDRRQVS